MAREFSIIVFGATGFTGKKVLEELLRSPADATLGKYAVAGRSKAGLEALLDKTGARERVGLIADVDVAKVDTVAQMAKRAKLVINCVGPFRLWGEPVFRACAEAGTSYVDMCGEPEFIERMEFKYGDLAKANGCHMASACGFDSIPGDLGTLVAQRQFPAPGVPSSVEMYMAIHAGPKGYNIHFATWHSAVLGIGSVASLRRLRADVKAAGKAAPAPKPAGPRPHAAPGLAYSTHPDVKAWHLPFPGADASVVRRTQAALTAAGEPTVHFVGRFTLASRWYAWVAVVVGGVMSLLARSAFGRALLLKAPGFFSYGLVTHAGPSEEQMAGTRTVTTFVARGFSDAKLAAEGQAPDKEVVVKVTTPDPGYNATSVLVVQTALTVLEERGRLPPPGVYPPGFLLRDTSIVERLKARGVCIEVGPPKQLHAPAAAPSL